MRRIGEDIFDEANGLFVVTVDPAGCESVIDECRIGCGVDIGQHAAIFARGRIPGEDVIEAVTVANRVLGGYSGNLDYASERHLRDE